MNDLDSYVERAKELIILGNNIANKADLSASSLARTSRPVDLEKSWLRPAPLSLSGKKKVFDVLVKPPFRNDMVSVDGNTNIFALEGLEAHEVELLMTHPHVPIKTLHDLASFNEMISESEKIFLTTRIPLLDQLVLHAKALSAAKK